MLARLATAQQVRGVSRSSLLGTTKAKLSDGARDKSTLPIVEAESAGAVKLDEQHKDVTTEPRNDSASLYPDQMDWLDHRQVRISRPSKNVMQSGTDYLNSWKIDFDSQPRWENWLMGWTSSADPLSNLSMTFPTKEAAIAHCEKNKLQWFVEDQPERKIRRKSYADNYSWNKRTRLGNK